MLVNWQKYRELTAGVVFLVFSVAYYHNATTIRVLSRHVFNAQFLPRFLGVAMIILSVAQIIYGIKMLNKIQPLSAESVGEAAAKSGQAGNIRILATIVILAIYIALLRQVGFLIMTMAYVFLQTLVLTPREKRNILFITGLSVVFSISVYLMFVRGFQLMLPRGMIF